VTFNNATLNDYVLLKSDGYPTYHLANVVDDHHMRISHIMRADEWISSTPLHVMLYAAFGWSPPLFAHLPMILGPDKSKLSKRHGATTVIEYRREGYLPEALFNFLALLGWAFDDKTEMFTREELVSAFTLERVGKTAAIFNKPKLDWMNGVYIRSLSPDDFARRAMPYLVESLPESVARPLDIDYVRQVTTLVQERVKVLAELGELCDFFFANQLRYTADALTAKGMDREQTVQALRSLCSALESLPPGTRRPWSRWFARCGDDLALSSETAIWRCGAWRHRQDGGSTVVDTMECWPAPLPGAPQRGSNAARAPSSAPSATDVRSKEVWRHMAELRMVVCCKQTLDPEAPPTAFKVDCRGQTYEPAAGYQPVNRAIR
jgi:glutamyl/glutaminyl-tRNA synthetase